ncbi:MULTISPECIES: NTP transferase domain-containing protein [unclassified Siphonobacter]|uniref:NTP transferase domain-containing protein n=1 Tax=unclassified Siphonobacter TaxID=2635712 RepID=UPI000CB57965|nr:MULTISPECIES: NTP transferase domain-containing protein [unclassified Siphonobacter]MDQ1089373.1 molybdopterin-guanine dinucleotide biosynthesis protein A [Siphonobacter sp. SORGH_AS_1065]MDR6195546.1 molybdopterin-guanine dinucleotide biosynthesis protein A [Siphonobacter sp. SORGH_AS_0500]PKK35345.1 hypothetical protein BWI96_17625 [Siphonobacter sp. SORGH_AS_0500]
MKQLPPLWGLVLAGGQSSRMGQDKAWLSYHDMPQWQYVQKLLQKVCERVYLSMNPSQPSVSGELVITDQYAEQGPMGGLMSAIGTNSEVAWLVMAVDMPVVTEETLRFLSTHRNPACAATVYRTSDNQIEPLLAIYEPSSFSSIHTLFEKKALSLQKFLGTSDVTFLSPPKPSELISIDTPEAYRYWNKH